MDDLLLVERSRRTSQNFYALWLLLSNIKLSKIDSNEKAIISEIKSILKLMKSLESKDVFEEAVKSFWSKYN